MKELHAPIPVEILEKELTEDKLIRNTNKANNEIYCFTHHDSPNLMKEVGRLRELTFRQAGGGTGKELDIDGYDIGENPYHQLIVWDPKAKKIIGGYRYIMINTLPKNEEGKIELATNRIFEFSEEFHEKFLPTTIELGRSFVVPEYQSISTNRKSLYALDNLWDGLGAVAVEYPEIEYFLGK